MDIYPTTEHYFQASKFTNPAIHQLIKSQPTPRGAFDEARRNDGQKRPDWESVKEDIMRMALYAKFTQYPHLKQLLISTGNNRLVENSPIDRYAVIDIS
jgi:ribA/ribD-fused uncharacterized protein